MHLDASYKIWLINHFYMRFFFLFIFHFLLPLKHMIVNLGFLSFLWTICIHEEDPWHTEGIKEWQRRRRQRKEGQREKREENIQITKSEKHVRVHVDIISMMWHLYGAVFFDGHWSYVEKVRFNNKRELLHRSVCLIHPSKKTCSL